MPTKGEDIIIPDIPLHQLIWERCLRKGCAICLVDNICDGKSTTFEEIYNHSRSCAAFLHEKGLKVGDFVGLCAPNCLEYMVAMLGIMGSGATVAPCNPRYTEDEILEQFGISEPKAVIVHESVLETMKKVKTCLSCIEDIYVIGKSFEYPTLAAILETNRDVGFLNCIKIKPSEDVAMLLHSSGTTGQPKSVMLTHQSLVAYVLAHENNFSWNTLENACGYMDRPMYHGGGFGVTLNSIAQGRKLIVEKEFQLETMLRSIDKYRVTHILITPPIIIQLVNDEETDKYDTSSLRVITAGGATMAPDILRRLMDKFNVVVAQTYGMTEMPLISLNNNMRTSPLSVGTVSSRTEVKIMDLVTKRECTAGQDGEILVRGPQLMKGYLKNPEVTANTIDKDGWLRTGDFGHMNGGLLYVVDRLKEVIKYREFQVSPAELESVVLKHPKAADVGVIGIPDEKDGELPKAFIVKKDETLTEDEVDAFVKSHLADYKHLRGGVEFVNAIPKSTTGKILRKELKQLAGVKA